ncbi:STAS domain-containing protein [bacterium]|nr:STAS domain-containing protein [bacterium]
MASLELTTEMRDQVILIKLKGFLNADSSPAFEETLQNLMDRHMYKIIIDFQELEYISSAGVGCFIGNIKRARNNRGDIRFLGLPAKIKRVFQLLDFEDFFQMFENEDEALQSFVMNE